MRPLRPEDRPGWAPLWEGYNAFYGRSGETALDPEVTALTWRRIHDPNTPMWGLAACSGGRIVGIAHFLFHLSTTSSGPYCYLEDLFVDEAERGRGVAEALIEAVSERAEAAGSPRVYWHTHHTNARAMRLYDRVAKNPGFLTYRRLLD